MDLNRLSLVLVLRGSALRLSTHRVLRAFPLLSLNCDVQPRSDFTIIPRSFSSEAFLIKIESKLKSLFVGRLTGR